jgi:arginase
MGDEHARYLSQILDLCDRLSGLVADATARGALPLVLGGDHSVALGSLLGMAKVHGPGGVVWIDAHGDLNTPETSPSGNVHGMVLAAALGLGGDSFNREGWPLPAVDPGKLALVGVRSLDEGERQLLGKLDAKVFTMNEVDRIGVEPCLREALAHASGAAFLHVSLDMDVVDPDYAPGVGARRPVVPRGTSRDGDRRQVRPHRLDGRRRGQPDPRPRERDRAARRRARGVGARSADPMSVGSTELIKERRRRLRRPREWE